MAFQLVDDDAEEFNGKTFAEYVLDCYDVIQWDEADWSDDWNGVLKARSALEFVRASLPAERAASLDRVDAFWRARGRIQPVCQVRPCPEEREDRAGRLGG